MSALDDTELVLLLALEIEDRSTAEQGALLRVAARIEAERNKATSRNLAARRGEFACRLVDMVEATQQRRLPKAARAKVERARSRWENP